MFLDTLIVLAVVTLFMAFVLSCLMFRLLLFRLKQTYMRLGALLISLFSTFCVLAVSLFSLSGQDFLWGWVCLCVTVPFLLFFYLTSRSRGIRFFTLFFIVDESILLIAIMAHLAALLLFGGALAADALLICGGLAGWCALVCRQFDRYCCKLLHLLEHGWGLLLAGAIALYGFLFLLIDYPSPIWQRPEDIPIALGIAVFLLVTLLVFLQMILCMVQTHTQIREQEMLRGELNAAREQYQALHDSLDEMRYIRHDVQHQMNLICEMLSAGEYDRLSEYLEGYRRDSAAFSDPPLQYTMQYTVNLLAGYYAHEADKHRIRTDFALNLPEQLPMEDSALASLFGNIWQNALEACTDLPPDADRFIETEAKYDGQRLLICCRNSSPVRQKDTFRQQYLTQRGDGHGYGLLSISHLADVRNGYSHFSFADQVFTTLVMIPLCEAVG